MPRIAEQIALAFGIDIKTNVANAPLKILSMTYNHNAPGGFWDVLYTTTCAPNLTLAPGSSCTFSIAFEANANA